LSNDLPPLKALRVFDACMRLGNFTRAGKELNVSQPAISHQIQQLEADLGIALFDRRGAQVVPTVEGQNYHRTISAALADIARATLATRRISAQPGLSLATYPGIAMFWLMPRLAKVREKEPALRARVTTAERDQDMRISDVDCAILFGDGNWPGYEAQLLIPEAVVPVASPALAKKLANKSRSELLKRGPLIHLEDSDHRWFTWRDWRDARSPKCSDIDAGVLVTNHGIAINQTLAGHGVSLGWLGVIDDMIANGLLAPLDEEPLRSARGYYLVSAPGFLLSRVGQLLMTMLVD
jgi:LysR family transcriptional regulator, glycine cleavage system transcriptional activator